MPVLPDKDAVLAQEGTRFPFIKLESALGRAKELFIAAGEHPVTVPDAFQTWKYSEKSSGGNQTISALKMYGLSDDSGNNEQRRLFFTQQGLRYFRDEREDVLSNLKREFALAPPLMRMLWNKWGVTPPADNIARSYLKIDLGMSDQNARSALGIYKENLDFAGLKAGDKISDPGTNTGSDTLPPIPKVGDYIQWTSNGANQFQTGRKITKTEGGYVWVHGSLTGIPMTEVIVVDPPKLTTPPQNIPVGKPGEIVTSEANEDISVLLTGNRLQITANIDDKGLLKLKKILDQYEQILKLLQ